MLTGKGKIVGIWYLVATFIDSVLPSKPLKRLKRPILIDKIRDEIPYLNGGFFKT